MVLRLIVLLLTIEYYTDFIMHHGITLPTDPLSLPEAEECSSEVIRAEVLHPDIQWGKVAAGE